jgi:hypothetical protein
VARQMNALEKKVLLQSVCGKGLSRDEGIRDLKCNRRARSLTAAELRFHHSREIRAARQLGPV